MMELAKEEAEKSNHKRKVGAVIVRGDRVLSKAHNLLKTHPKFGSGWFSRLHAEGHAIYKAVKKGIDLRGATIYVYRMNSFGDALAKPCSCCMGLIHKHGIKNVVYSEYCEEYNES